MGIPALPDEVLLKAVALRAEHPTSAAAARAAGMKVETLKYQLKQASLKGLAGFGPILEGFELKETTEQQNADGSVHRRSIKQVRAAGEVYEPLEGFQLKQRSTYVDGDRRIVGQWNIEKPGALDPIYVAEHIAKVFADYEPAAPVAPPPANVSADMCTVVPCNDLHMGMSSWGKQTGANWDLKIAEPTIGDALVETIERSPASAKCILLGGGDLLHADNKRNETTGGTPQDVDGRYEKIIEAAIRLMLRVTDAALLRHDHIIIRLLKGNHDEHSYVAVLYFLKAWYRNEPRVTVDVDPSDYFWFRFGSVLLGACHGHQSSNHISKMPSIMAHRRAEDWGATKHRYVHGFHLHHSAKIATEGNGVICEIHQAPIPQDAWHFASGFLSGRSVQAITYHAKFGEIGRVRTAIMDA